jgi:peptide methionine sulfoxide reductase MsrB
MCRNHYRENAPDFKGHRCEFDNEEHIERCTEGCKKVDIRRKNVAKDKKQMYKLEKAKNSALPISLSVMELSESSKAVRKTTRTCRKCKLHGLGNVALKGGHLEYCPFRYCICEMCKITNERREASNDFTKHYRIHKIETQKCSRSEESMGSPDSGFATDSDRFSSGSGSPMFSEPESPQDFMNVYDTWQPNCAVENSTQDCFNFTIDQSLDSETNFDQLASYIVGEFPLETLESLENSLLESFMETENVSEFQNVIDLIFMIFCSTRIYVKYFHQQNIPQQLNPSHQSSANDILIPSDFAFEDLFEDFNFNC